MTTIVGRYADLTGKTAVVAGAAAWTCAVVDGLAANGMLLAVVAPDRDVVETSVTAAERHGGAVFGVTADPSSEQAWSRVRPHVEQRLGPIDVAVALGDGAVRAAVRQAMEPDMAARRRGVVIEVIGAADDAGDAARAPRADGVRYRVISVGTAGIADGDVAAVVVACASDVLAARSVQVALG